MAYATRSKYKLEIYKPGNPNPQIEASWRVRGRQLYKDDGTGKPTTSNLSAHMKKVCPNACEGRIINRETNEVVARVRWT